MQVVRETERVRAADDWAQGDIIHIDNPHNVDLAPRLGIIINADCDLAHMKTDGVIAYLPVYTFREYLELFWAQSHVDDVARTAATKVLEVVGDEEQSTANLCDMLRASPQTELVEHLSSAADLKKGDRIALANSLAKLAIASDETLPPLERFSALCRNEKEPERHARKQILDARRAMGDGHFLISEILDQPEVGFVVRMRRIWAVPEDLCFTSTATQRASSRADVLTAVRVARLTPLYRFKVLQIFAQQFSRIGLPDEVTALGDLAIDDLVQSFTGSAQ
jgi:hypothetical protein